MYCNWQTGLSWNEKVAPCMYLYILSSTCTCSMKLCIYMYCTCSMEISQPWTKWDDNVGSSNTCKYMYFALKLLIAVFCLWYLSMMTHCTCTCVIHVCLLCMFCFVLLIKSQVAFMCHLHVYMYKYCCASTVFECISCGLCCPWRVCLRQCLESDAERLPALPTDLRLHYASLIASVINSFPEKCQFTLFPQDQRKTLFFLLAGWSGPFSWHHQTTDLQEQEQKWDTRMGSDLNP